MQLLGKNYLDNDNIQQTTDLQKEDAYEKDGIDALCEAVEQKNGIHMPSWMMSAGNLIRENSRHLVIAASVLVIGVAVYLNWSMYTGGNEDAVKDGAIASGVSDVLSGTDDQSDANAQAVGESAISDDDYFAVSQINRQRARDEAIAVLQDVVDGAENLSEVQNEALAEIAQIAADIEHEATIESLVKGKGFTECVAVISGESANVIVKSSALLPNEVAQIQEIVYETSGIVPANVKIIEK